jgi:hypothetical protein
MLRGCKAWKNGLESPWRRIDIIRGRGMRAWILMLGCGDG